MQPDPAIFLSGARRTLLELAAAGKVADPMVALAMRRLGEALVRMDMRRDEIGEIAVASRNAQESLLRELDELMHERGVEQKEAPVAQRVTTTERAIQEWDDRSWAISRNLRTLREHSAADARINELFRKALELEEVSRERYVRASDAKRMASEPQPTQSKSSTPTAAELESYLTTLAQVPVSVGNVSQLVGINTKDIVFFDVEGVSGWPRSVVMRKMRDFNANPLVSMDYEFTLLGELRRCGIPVPRPLAVDATGEVFGHPFIIMERLPGCAKLPGAGRTKFGNRGEDVCEQIAKHLAAVHAIRLEKVARQEQKKMAPAEMLRLHIDRYYRIWQTKQMEPSATLEQGFLWVMDNVAALEPVVTLVHGDLDFRNILFDGPNVSAILDWERSHLGHPAEDLAYLRADVETIMDWDAFLRMYRAHGGREVSAHALRVFHIWSYVFKASCATALGLHAYALGEHTDFLLASTSFIEGEVWTDQLRKLLSAA